MSNNEKEYKYIDCHSHPHDDRYIDEGIDIDNKLEELKAEGGVTIAIGTDYENSKKAIDLSLKHENVWATIGIHPVDRNNIYFEKNKFDELLKYGQGKVVAIGECGLDYYRLIDKSPSNQVLQLEKERQKSIFIEQIKYANENNLPLVLHGRPSKGSMDAYSDILDILQGYSRGAGGAPHLRGHAHFFVGDIVIAKRFLDLGFLLSFDGPVTFTSDYDEVIKFIPIESLMIETDSPYAAPKPYRGQINYSTYVIEIAKKISLLKGLSLEEVLEITKQNAINLFKLKL